MKRVKMDKYHINQIYLYTQYIFTTKQYFEGIKRNNRNFINSKGSEIKLNMTSLISVIEVGHGMNQYLIKRSRTELEHN
jgi:phage anti-repressor protein